MSGLNSYIVNVKEYGARGDGTTDDTTAIQNAINTGRTVFFPLGTYQVGTPLTVATPTQILMGEGYLSILRAKTGFVGTQLMQFTSGQPAPVLKDLWLTSQTYGAVSVGLTSAGIPRGKLTRCRITGFATGLDITGNCGGWDIIDLGLWNSTNSISIDGSQDTIHMSGIRVWPFDDPNGATLTASFVGTTMTVSAISAGALGAGQNIAMSGVTGSPFIVAQLSGTAGRTGTYQLSVSQGSLSSRATAASGLAFIGATGISSGRCDVLNICNSMFICLNQIHFFAGLSGNTIANITTTDFDTFNGIVQSDGRVTVSACTFTGGTNSNLTCGSNVSWTGGKLTITGCDIVNSVSTNIGAAGGSADSISVSDCNFDMGANISSAFSATSGITNFNFNTIQRTSAVGGAYAIAKSGTARMTCIGNRSPIDGTGNFIQVTVDNWDKVQFNTTGAWTNSFPTPSVGVYSNN